MLLEMLELSSKRSAAQKNQGALNQRRLCL